MARSCRLSTSGFSGAGRGLMALKEWRRSRTQKSQGGGLHRLPTTAASSPTPPSRQPRPAPCARTRYHPQCAKKHVSHGRAVSDIGSMPVARGCVTLARSSNLRRPLLSENCSGPPKFSQSSCTTPPVVNDGQESGSESRENSNAKIQRLASDSRPDLYRGPTDHHWKRASLVHQDR